MLLFSQLVRNTFPVSKRIPHSFFGKLICILYVLRLNMQQKILLGMWKMHMGTGMLRSPSRICVSGLNIILDHSKLQSSQFLSTFYESKYFYINTFKKSGGKKKKKSIPAWYSLTIQTSSASLEGLTNTFVF